MENNFTTKIKIIGGGSLGIIITSEYAQIMGYEAGDIVRVVIEKIEVEP